MHARVRERERLFARECVFRRVSECMGGWVGGWVVACVRMRLCGIERLSLHSLSISLCAIERLRESEERVKREWVCMRER